MGSYVLDYHALYLQHFMSTEWKAVKDGELFLEQVGPRILLLEGVDYFGTSDNFSGRKKEQLSGAKLRW